MGVAARLKVLHIGKFYPPHMGGIETHLEALCGALKNSVDVRVLVANDGGRTEESKVEDIPVVRAGAKALVASTPICPSMPRLLRDSDADIVHIHLPNPMAILACLVAGQGRRLVVSYHSDIVKQKYLYSALKPFEARVLARSAAIIASSSTYLETSPVLKRHRERCHVIPYGISPDHFAAPDAQAVSDIKNRYGGRIILAVGRLVYYKGFEYLIRSLPKIDGQVLLIGEGPLRGELEALAASCGVADRIAFLGNVKGSLLAYYHAADLFVLPSIARSEAFGIVQIEAMAAGKPVINTQLNSGATTVSLHGVTGLTVPAADPDALAQAANLLLADEDLRLAYGRAAYLRARAEFSLDSMVSRTLALYEGVMGRQDEVAGKPLSWEANTGD